MNYNLTQGIQGPITDTYGNRGDDYGSMPYSALMVKYEETNTGDDEFLYDDYVRGEIVSQMPDKALFEYEEGRSGTNRSYGILQLRENGHRGDQETPYRPEYFDGFGGPEDNDPRGINVEPDMKQYVKQVEQRMRFQKFNPDGDASITGGGRSETQEIRDRQETYKRTKAQWKWFDRQLDGRTTGLRREFYYKPSESSKQIHVRSYGDAITDYALTPQRRANLISSTIIRDTEAWRKETADSDFTAANYNQICRRAATKHRVGAGRGISDSVRGDGEVGKSYKSAAILMANIIRAKTTAASTDGDIDRSTAHETMRIKTAPLHRDLALVLNGVRQDADWSTGDDSMMRKTAMPTQMEHLMRVTDRDGSIPEHHKLNAELMYKSVQPGADMQKIKREIITDAKTEYAANSTMTYRAAKRATKSGAKLGTDDDTDRDDSRKTANYRHLVVKSGDNRIVGSATGARFGTEGKSQVRRATHQNYHGEVVGDTEQMTGYNDNDFAERHAAPLGKKSAASWKADRDGGMGDGLTAD